MRASELHSPDSWSSFLALYDFREDASNIDECSALCTGTCLLYVMGSYGFNESLNPDGCWHLHYIPDPEDIQTDCCFYCKRIQGTYSSNM